jgi:hypothetical protein
MCYSVFYLGCAHDNIMQFLSTIASQSLALSLTSHATWPTNGPHRTSTGMHCFGTLGTAHSRTRMAALAWPRAAHSDAYAKTRTIESAPAEAKYAAPG